MAFSSATCTPRAATRRASLAGVTSATTAWSKRQKGLSTRPDARSCTAAWNIVNVELPHFHLHELTMTAAAAREVKGYQPCVVGPFTHRGGGIRTAYIEA